jgi:hypothetical protein
MRRKDVDEIILKVLSSGPKTASDLRQAVVSETGVSERVYHYHREKLLKSGRIEEIPVREETGRITVRYAIRQHHLFPKTALLELDDVCISEAIGRLKSLLLRYPSVECR